MFVEIALAAWTAAGLLWWIISWRLVAADAKPKGIVAGPRVKKSLTVFKPLPPLEGKGPVVEARGLESFIAQLKDDDELLLGVHEADWQQIETFLHRMEAVYPGARIVPVRRTESDAVSNPKIAWQRHLAPLAKGDLWLWSDADIVAPPDFLRQAQAEFEICGAEMLTFPYAVRNLPRRPALLDALFANTEFYPGVLLLRSFGTVDFGLGAAMLFSRESFTRKVKWQKLGETLADDFMLGQALKPVRVGHVTLETVSDSADWPGALAHYLRWEKTVCWVRPGGFAARILVMPTLGWMAYLLLHLGNIEAWVGLLGLVFADVLFTALIFRHLRCRMTASDLVATAIWSVGRGLLWFSCWLPGNVKWRSKAWTSVEEPVRMC